MSVRVRCTKYAGIIRAVLPAGAEGRKGRVCVDLISSMKGPDTNYSSPVRSPGLLFYAFPSTPGNGRWAWVLSSNSTSSLEIIIDHNFISHSCYRRSPFRLSQPTSSDHFSAICIRSVDCTILFASDWTSKSGSHAANPSTFPEYAHSYPPCLMRSERPLIPPAMFIQRV